MSSRSGTVFWRVATVLIAVQIATAVLAAGFTAWFAEEAHRSLASVALAARLDALAEEIERRSLDQEGDFVNFTDELRLDLSYRFPDPVAILGLDGKRRELFLPAGDGFEGVQVDPAAEPLVPDILDLEQTFVDIVIDISDRVVLGGYATAPLFDEAGFGVGFVLVQPLSRSLSLELADTREAFRRSVRFVALAAFLTALILGAFFTWWLVRPLREMAAQVSRIGEGSYETNLRIDGNDEFARLARAINQMTARVRKSIESISEADRVRRELVANVGHDLRTPLAAVRAHLEEAERLRSEGRAVEADEAIQQARRQSEHLNALVDDLFELSRLEGTRAQLRLEPVPLAELLSDTIAANTSAARQCGVLLETGFESGLPILQADGSRLLRLLNNLISNAIRHTPDGGRVTITARQLNRQVLIAVSDTGEGISEDDLDRLFDRYYRGAGSRTRADGSRARGTGLGLAISKAIAEAHHGSLSVRSKKGEGTEMVLALPV